MDTPDIDKIVGYTKQFIDAATPIAKQAYEIGLVTLRIDAAQAILVGFVVGLAAVLILRKVIADVKEAGRKAQLPENNGRLYQGDASYHLPGMGILHFISGMAALLAGIFSACLLLNAWVWVKLISPELWLAHKAVEKLIN